MELRTKSAPKGSSLAGIFRHLYFFVPFENMNNMASQLPEMKKNKLPIRVKI